MVYCEILGLSQRDLEPQSMRWIERMLAYKEMIADAMDRDLENLPYGHAASPLPRVARQAPAAELLFTPEEMAMSEAAARAAFERDERERTRQDG